MLTSRKCGNGNLFLCIYICLLRLIDESVSKGTPTPASKQTKMKFHIARAFSPSGERALSHLCVFRKTICGI